MFITKCFPFLLGGSICILVQMILICQVAQWVKNPPAVQETQEIWVWSLSWRDPLEKEMATHPVFLPGEFHGQRSLEGYTPWGRKESDSTGRPTLALFRMLGLALGAGHAVRSQGGETSFAWSSRAKEGFRRTNGWFQQWAAGRVQHSGGTEEGLLTWSRVDFWKKWSMQGKA